MNDTIRSQFSGKLQANYKHGIIEPQQRGNAYTTVRVPGNPGTQRGSIIITGSTRSKTSLRRRDSISSQNIETFFKRQAPSSITTFSATEFQKRYQNEDESKTSAETPKESPSRAEVGIRSFLERYSLPRVVKTSQDGDALLLFKYLEDYTSVIGTRVSVKRKKDALLNDNNNVLYFPDGYQGWFSLTNEDKNPTAIAYSSIVQLIQEQVYTFLSTTSIVGYIFNPEQLGSYLKHTSNAGEIFHLRGIFQHNPRIPTVQNPKNKGRDLANRYAQLLNANTNQEMYVPLIAKGCFYEIAQTQVRPAQNIKSLCKVRARNPLQLDKDCIYRINHLVKLVSIPVTVKLIAGQVPKTFGKTSSTDVFILRNKVADPVLFACKLPTNNDDQYQIKYFNYQSDIKLSRTLLGFESEQSMLQSPRLQNAFAYCRQNFDKFYSRARTYTEFQTFQTDLHNKHIQTPSPEIISPTQTRGLLNWFKNLKFESSHNGQNSTDRYKDMSKLIDETFGARKQTNPVKKSASFMFTSKKDCIDVTSSGLTPFQMNQSLDSVYKPQRVIAFSEENLSSANHSYITDRLCSKFHVKTKNIRKREVSAPPVLRINSTQSMKVEERSVHQVIEDMPYVSALDALHGGSSRSRVESPIENIYVEICENDKAGDKSDFESSYVHLNLTSTEGDEPIYSTLK